MRPDLAPTVALAVFAGWYLYGARRWRRSPTLRARRFWFAAALAVLVAALLSPLDELSGESFTAHMIQHMLLAVLAPPLIVMAAPEVAMIGALPRSGRRAVARLRHRLQWLAAFATAPFVAWSLHTGAIWAWHAPRLYDLALENEALHAAEHLSFVATGCLIWWCILPRRRYALGMIILFATAMQTGVLGALLALSSRVLYPAQAAAGAHWGLTPLEDQHMAGLVMWVPGGILYVIAMSVLFIAWLEPTGRRAKRAVLGAGVAAGAALSGCGRAQASVVQGGDAERGRQTIEAMGCGACHVVGGVPGARGEVGPPLSGVAGRAIIGGVLPNTPDNMMAWIEDPPSFAPRTAMPNLGVTPQAARDIVAYLYTLR
jgi:cytochrome c oxidase assembly factor CtaG